MSNVYLRINQNFLILFYVPLNVPLGLGLITTGDSSLSPCPRSRQSVQGKVPLRVCPYKKREGKEFMFFIELNFLNFLLILKRSTVFRPLLRSVSESLPRLPVPHSSSLSALYSDVYTLG